MLIENMYNASSQNSIYDCINLIFLRCIDKNSGGCYILLGVQCAVGRGAYACVQYIYCFISDSAPEGLLF